MIFRLVCIGSAALIIALLPLYEKKLNALISRAGQEKHRSEGREEEDDGEDIVSNKNKWRLLIAGYCIFFLFMIFTTVSIVTLNTKINNVSLAAEDIMDRLSALEK